MSERRSVVYLVGLGLLFFLLILAAFLGRAYLKGAVSEESWTKQNELVLAGLPLYPGSIESRTPYTTGERDPRVTTRTADGGPYRGYWTTHTYTLPIGARPDLVLDYYAQHIGDWGAENEQATSCEIRYRRGREVLDLKACDGSLVLSVNYRELD
jgi:hypothetical protein